MSPDPEHDADVTNDKVSDSAFEAGPIRFDPSKDIPVLSNVIGGGQSALDMADGATGKELGSIGGNVLAIAAAVPAYKADPLNFLINAGLSFLIDVIQPLEDALGYVTGNTEKMDAKIHDWERVTNALGPLSEEIRSAANDGLLDWEGKAADAAKKRINSFADGVDGLSGDTGTLTTLFALAKVLMEAAKATVIAIISMFVEWLIFTWIPALAAAPVTFGASTAAAGTATGIRASMVATKVGRFIQKVAKVLLKMRRLLYKMHPKLMRRVQVRFQLRGPGGQFTKGWIGSWPALRETLTNPKTYIPNLYKLPPVVGQAGDNATDPSSDKSTDGLDPNV